MKQFTYITIICLLSLTSCKSKQEKEAIVLIDKQISYIDSVIEEYRILPIDSLNYAYMNKLNNQAKQIQVEFGNNEALSEDDKSVLSSYADYVHGLVDLVHLLRKQHLHYSLQKQMEKLRSDIEHGVIPNDSINFYIDHELESFNLMQSDIDKVLGIKNIGNYYRSIETKADSIIEASFPK